MGQVKACPFKYKEGVTDMMPGAEIYIPDYREEDDPNEYERYIEKNRPEQVRPERMTEEEIEDFFRDVPF